MIHKSRMRCCCAIARNRDPSLCAYISPSDTSLYPTSFLSRRHRRNTSRAFSCPNIPLKRSHHPANAKSRQPASPPRRDQAFPPASQSTLTKTPRCWSTFTRSPFRLAVSPKTKAVRRSPYWIRVSHIFFSFQTLVFEVLLLKVYAEDNRGVEAR